MNSAKNTPSAAHSTVEWTFLTNYTHVLLCIAQDCEIRVRDISLRVGITERAVQRILADLVENGYLQSFRQGRRNHYRINDDLPLRHPLEGHQSIGALLKLMARFPPGGKEERDH